MHIAWVLVGLLICTWVALTFDLDRVVAGWFFTDTQGWRYQNVWLWKMLYQYGTIPGLLLTLTALMVFSIGLIHPRWRSWRYCMLVIVLTSIIGAGLLVNSILKPYCGRPRPREVVEFSGQWNFCQPCFDSQPGKGMSFPCGHCTMGFLFVTLAYCRRRSKLLAYAGTGFGLVLGGLLGVTRAAQGAHFLTDTLWSLGVIVLISLMSYYWAIPFFRRVLSPPTATVLRRKVFLGFALFLLAVVITALFLTRRPFYESEIRIFALPSGIERLLVVSNVDWVKTDIRYQGDQIRIEVLGRGFAAPGADQFMEIESYIRQDTLEVGVIVDQEGYFSELRHELQIVLPATVQDRVNVEIRQPSSVPKYIENTNP